MSEGPEYLPNERLYNKPKIPLKLFDVFYEVFEGQGPLQDDKETAYTFHRLCAKKMGESRYQHYNDFSKIENELQAYKELGLAEKTNEGWRPTREGERFYGLPETRRYDWLFYKFFNLNLSENENRVAKTAMGVLAYQLKHGVDPSLTEKELAVSALTYPDDVSKAYQTLINYRSSDKSFDEWINEHGGRVGRMRKSGERLFRLLKEHPFFHEQTGDYTIKVPEYFFPELVEYGRKAKQSQSRFIEDVDVLSRDNLKKMAKPKRKWIVRRLMDELSISEVEARNFAKKQASSIFKTNDEIDKMSKEERKEYRRQLVTFFERPHANFHSQLANMHPKQVKKNQREFIYFIKKYLESENRDHGEIFEDFEKEFSSLGASSIGNEAKQEIRGGHRGNGEILEEYVWKLLTSLEGESVIRPNASVAKNGRFQGHALGGQGDIEGKAGDCALLLEPTLINSRDQYDKEATQIEGHTEGLEERNQKLDDNMLRIQGQERSVGLFISPRDQSKDVLSDDFIDGHEKRTLREVYEMARTAKGGDTTTFLPMNLFDFYTMIKRAHQEGKSRSALFEDLEVLADRANTLTKEEWINCIKEYCSDLTLREGVQQDMEKIKHHFKDELQKQNIAFHDIKTWTSLESPSPDGFVVELPDGHQLRIRIQETGDQYAWEGDLQNGNHERIKHFQQQNNGAISEIAQEIRRALDEKAEKNAVQQQ